jgi:hypothetical protein
MEHQYVLRKCMAQSRIDGERWTGRECGGYSEDVGCLDRTDIMPGGSHTSETLTCGFELKCTSIAFLA